MRYLAPLLATASLAAILATTGLLIRTHFATDQFSGDRLDAKGWCVGEWWVLLPPGCVEASYARFTKPQRFRMARGFRHTSGDVIRG